MIRKATKEDIDAIESTYIELLAHEQNTVSYSNWKLGLYPTRKVAETGVENGTLFVLEENNQICASMLLNQIQPDEYAAIEWHFLAEENEVLVIHTLCIPPSKAGCGFGTSMVRFALEYAKGIGYKTVRLDTYLGNQPAVSLYESLNFRYAGSADVLLQGIIPEKQKFFEHPITIK